MDEITTKSLLFFLIVSGMGWIILLVGIRSHREQKNREIWEYSRTTGTIAEYVRKETRTYSRGVRRIVYWCPVIAFTAEGRPFRLEYENRLNQEEHPVGQTVDVLYDINNPEHFHLDCDPAFSKGSGNIMRLGLVWILASAALTVALAVFVGGVSLDFDGLVRRILGQNTPVTKIEKTKSSAADRDFQYIEQPNSTVLIKSYSGSAEKLTVPVLLDGHIVSGLTMGAFSRCPNLRMLTVPGHVKSIPTMSFVACLSLTDLTIGEGVQSIGSQAVLLCPSLQNVSLPASLTGISDDAFPDDCTALFHVVGGSPAEAFCRKKNFSFISSSEV